MKSAAFLACLCSVFLSIGPLMGSLHASSEPVKGIPTVSAEDLIENCTISLTEKGRLVKTFTFSKAVIPFTEKGFLNLTCEQKESFRSLIFKALDEHKSERGTASVSIFLPEGIQSLKCESFFNCDIEKVTLPMTVTSLDNNSFENCKTLQEVVLNHGLKLIGSGAFHSCEKLKKIAIPETVESMGGWIFIGCASLITMNIPEKVTAIPAYTFAGCRSLKKIDFSPKTDIHRIGQGAFSNCHELSSVLIPSKNEIYLEKGAFWPFTRLSAIELEAKRVTLKSWISFFEIFPNKAIIAFPNLEEELQIKLNRRGYFRACYTGEATLFVPANSKIQKIEP